MDGQATVTKEEKKTTIYQLCTMALMAAVLCVLGPVAVPIGEVPISLATLVIYLMAYLLGSKMGTISCIVYLLLGLVGLPVFTGYSGGLAKLAGPTGGYLVGYIFLAFICGLFVEKAPNKVIWCLAGMISGTAVLYLFGTIWFVLMMHSTVSYAFTVCVLPFLVWDLGKMAAAALLGREIRKRLVAANLI